MDDFTSLPIELLINIFNYVPYDVIAISQVCRYFSVIATTHIRKMSICLQKENERDIEKLSKQLEKFNSLKSLKVRMSFDVNITEKAEFCASHSKKISHLTLSEFSFLNPFFDKPYVRYDRLHTLVIENSDITSSTDDLPDFILVSCNNLKNLRMAGCSGLEIQSLNKIGRELNKTKIERFELHPTYSYFNMPVENNRDESWTIENLKTLSIRSKLVVMKKNFVRNMLGNNRTFPELRKLELIAELNFGSNFVSILISQFPNLECLAIGKVADVHSEDFLKIFNHYKSLDSLEFHFIHHDEQLDLRYLQTNASIKKLTVGLTKSISMENLRKISQSTPNLTHLNVILYYLMPSTEQYIEQLVKIFPQVRKITFAHIGSMDKIKILL